MQSGRSLRRGVSGRLSRHRKNKRKEPGVGTCLKNPKQARVTCGWSVAY